MAESDNKAWCPSPDLERDGIEVGKKDKSL